MDTSRPITFGTLQLNDVALSGGVLVGCSTDSAKFGIEVAQYLDPRSAMSGLDAGELSAGIATLRLTGTLYGSSKTDLYSRLETMRQLLMPSQSESTMTFYLQSAALGELLHSLALNPQVEGFVYERARGYGTPSSPLAIPWQCTFIIRPPWSRTGIVSASTVNGSLTHRGNYRSPIYISLGVSGGPGTIRCVFSNGQEMQLSVKAGNQVVTYDGYEHIAYAGVTGPNGTKVAMDQIGLEDDQRHPVAHPGTFTWNLTPSGCSITSTYIEFEEAWSL